MIIGYARCSTADQNLDWQRDKLRDAGCERIYEEKITGTKRDRPELNRMLDALREGDTVIVCELTRLSRSVQDLFALVEMVNTAKANIRSLKEPWLDTTTPHGRLLFSIFAGISQFERDLIQQRTQDGLAAARARGRMGGRPSVKADDIEQAMTLYDSGRYPIKKIAEITSIGKATLYKYIRLRKESEG